MNNDRLKHLAGINEMAGQQFDDAGAMLRGLLKELKEMGSYFENAYDEDINAKEVSEAFYDLHDKYMNTSVRPKPRHPQQRF